MATPKTTFHLLGLSGSLRQASTTTAVLVTLAEKMPDNARLTLFPLNDIALYNGDFEGERLPGPVRALKQAVADCDGLILCTPEYNHGMSGVLKNALDWVSRPAFASPLKDKPTLLMASSNGNIGGARAYAQMHETILSVLGRIVPRPQICIAHVERKIVDGRLADADNLAFCLQGVEDLLREIRLVSPML